jgi:hypothetical protein
MKTIYSIILFYLLLPSCLTNKNKLEVVDISGTYFLKTSNPFQAFSENNYSHIDLKKDGNYELYRGDQRLLPIEYCELASEGKWKRKMNNIIEIDSRDSFLEKKGYEYEVVQVNKESPDSIYFDIKLQDNIIDHVTFRLYVNKSLHNPIFFNGGRVVIDKYDILKKYFTEFKYKNNIIDISINADTGGANVYRSRASFYITVKDLYFTDYNYFTVTFPYFNSCFFMFEPFEKDFILINKKGELNWLGEIWVKK